MNNLVNKVIKISIIIPFRDKKSLLAGCIESILKNTSYENYEIILVDNESTKKETKDYLKKVAKNNRIVILKYYKPFNFSAINNFAARKAKGEYILFLNNDTEVISYNWLNEMVKGFKDANVGAVGAKLFYPNGKIQHAGVMMEKQRLAIHAFRNWEEGRAEFKQACEWSAVTAACMMTKKELFLRVGGFDEINLPIAYNDVDYCLKLKENGYKILCIAEAKLYHHESVSRKSDIMAKIFNRKRYNQFLLEQAFMRKKWENSIINDPFYNKNYI